VSGPYDADALAQRSARHIERAGELRVAAGQAPRPRTEANVLVPLNAALIELRNVRDECELLAEVHPAAEVRSVAERFGREVTRGETELHQDHGLYEALGDIDAATLDPLALRMLELTRRDMRRAGVELEDAYVDQARMLRDQIVALEQTFSRNIRDDVRYVELDPLDLGGLPDDYVAAHPPGPAGRVRISTNYPDYFPLLAFARSASARKQLMTVAQQRATPENLGVLNELLDRRHRLATLLGYSSWADYATEDKMVGTAKAAWEFIERAYQAAAESARTELEQFLAILRRDDPGIDEIGLWDLAYCTERLKADRFAFDSRDLRPYFAYRSVRDGIIDLAADLFSLTFSPVEAPAWHPSVETFDVTLDGSPLGRISLDMHPRAGKRKHNSCFDLQTGVSGVQMPHAVLVCNFPDPADGPALMQHSEVVTFFHEFGHLVHHLVATPEWVRLARVDERDFVEAPSQFLEEWTYDVGVLARLGRHVVTGDPVPAAHVEQLRAARDVGRAVSVHRQLFLAAISLAYHDRDPAGIDTTAVLFSLAPRYSPCALPEGSQYEASFGHLAGYSATYYTYMWSLAIAKDLAGAIDPASADARETKRYRDLVLRPGGSKPASELLREFLGRPSGFDAFTGWLSAGAPNMVNFR
jgi:thimet oligopeptidase